MALYQADRDHYIHKSYWTTLLSQGLPWSHLATHYAICDPSNEQPSINGQTHDHIWRQRGMHRATFLRIHQSQPCQTHQPSTLRLYSRPHGDQADRDQEDCISRQHRRRSHQGTTSPSALHVHHCGWYEDPHWIRWRTMTLIFFLHSIMKFFLTRKIIVRGGVLRHDEYHPFTPVPSIA